MSCGLGIREVTFSQIIFISMDNQRSSEQILGLQMGNQIGIMDIFSRQFNISQIPCVSGVRGPGSASMVARRTDVKMFAGPQTSFASQIPRLVNVKSMFSRWEFCKCDGQACLGPCLLCDGFALNFRGLENRNCYRIS
jgi:hypothetical protein